MSLLTNLLAWWKLDEASGTRFDELGAYNLSDINTVTSAAGLLNGAASFNAANVESLATSAATFPSVTSGLWVNGWIYPTVGGEVFALDNVSGTDRLLQVVWNSGFGGFIQCTLFGSGSSITWNVGGGDVPASTWSRVSVWWDPADGKGRIKINNNTNVVSSGSLVALNAGAVVPVEIGDLGGFHQPYGGLADEFAMWNRVPTPTELTDTWNGGTPLPFPNPGAMTGTCSFGFGAAGTLSGSGRLLGTSALAFAATGTMVPLSAIAGTASMSFSASGTVLGAGALAGTATMVFGAVVSTDSGFTARLGIALSRPGNIVLGFGSSAVPNFGFLVGNATLTFGAAAVLRGAGALAGTATLTFGTGSSMTAIKQLVGAATLTLSATGTMRGPKSPYLVMQEESSMYSGGYG